MLCVLCVNYGVLIYGVFCSCCLFVCYAFACVARGVSCDFVLLFLLFCCLNGCSANMFV